MNSLIDKLYNNPRTGFVGVHKLYLKAKEINPSIKKKDIATWFKNNESVQRFTTQTPKFDQFKIASSNPHEWHMDLMFWKKRPILVTININSRIGYVKLLKNKTANIVREAIIDFIEKHKPLAILSDNGSEFINDKVENIFMSYKITHKNALAGDHTVLGKIDRFIRTLKSLLTKTNTKTITQSKLNDIIYNYNNTFHSSIDAKPIEMKDRVITDEVDHNKTIYKQVKEKLKQGSIVKYKLKTKQFQKEGERYSKTNYEIIGFDGLKIKIRSKNNHILFKSVNDLKLVNGKIQNASIKGNEIWEIEEILDHKVKTNKNQIKKYSYLVKWKDYSKHSWISQKNLRIFNKNQLSQLELNYFK